MLDAGLVSFIQESEWKSAEDAEMSAAYSGARHDGGSEKMRAVLKAWQDGLNNRIPEAYKHYETEYAKQNDTEYSEFLRLQDKFNNWEEQ